MIIALQLLVALLGVLMYVLSSNPKLQEIGRLMFFAGLFSFLVVFHGGMIGLTH